MEHVALVDSWKIKCGSLVGQGKSPQGRSVFVEWASTEECQSLVAQLGPEGVVEFVAANTRTRGGYRAGAALKAQVQGAVEPGGGTDRQRLAAPFDQAAACFVE